ncbi:MAG: hypothetical protein LBJ00_04260 [Planctomycetaceae bacterium]|jgi:hypothetical protein|nr:hypothetical protein [Planctomycetaceae bacterium]
MINLSPEVPLLSYRNSQDIRDVTSDRHAPDSVILSLQIDMFQMALGRGICSKFIDVDYSKTKVIDRKGEVCYVFFGNGFYMSRSGNWEVHVSPEVAYMVRYARFFSDGDTMLEIETFGVKNKSDCVYPEKSEIRIPIRDKHITHFFVFSEAELSFNSEIFDLVTRDYDRVLPDGSVVMDDVSGKDKINVVGGEIEHEPYQNPPANLAQRLIFIGVVDLVGIFLIFYLYRRSRLKRQLSHPKEEAPK